MTPAEALAAIVEDAALPPGGRLLAVLGDPVLHSLSPALHGAALKAAGLPHRYVAVRCRAAAIPGFFAAARRLPVLGFNLTAPLKQVALPHLDDCMPIARAVGAVNTIERRGRRLVGHNTDVDGFTLALEEELGVTPAGRVALVIGAGGAARAVVVGLLKGGVARIDVLARRREQAAALVADLVPLATGVRAALRPVTAPAAEADLIVQATPVGLDVSPGGPGWAEAEAAFAALPWADWAGRAVAVDLNYRPARTAFLACAERAGCRTQNGLGMLLHQAAEAFAIWTGEEPSLTAMRAAVSPPTSP